MKRTILIILFYTLGFVYIKGETPYIRQLLKDIFNKELLSFYRGDPEPLLIKGSDESYLRDTIDSNLPSVVYKYRRRYRSGWYDKLDFSIESDTVYILENDRSPRITTVYSSKDTLGYYPNVMQGITYRKTFLHPYIQLTLLRQWNVKELQRLGNDPDRAFISPRIVYVTRIIFRNGKYKIDCTKYFNFR
jgi:hypothetical protein